MTTETENRKSDKPNEIQKNDTPSHKHCWWYNPIERFTFFVAIFTFFLVVVGAVVGTLQYCTLQKTDQTSRLRDRAFVYFATPTYRLYPNKNPSVWAIEINLVNAGAMPARSFSIRYKCIVSKQAIDDPFSLKNLPAAETGKVIGPKQFVSFLAHQSIQGQFSQVQDIIDKKLFVYVIARLEYLDGFDFEKVRVTEMSRQLHLDAAGGYSFHLAGPHNCTDDDCD